MDKSKEIKRLIAEDLLRIRAVFLRPEEPFTWASGIKSPIYCDNRLLISHYEYHLRSERLVENISAI